MKKLYIFSLCSLTSMYMVAQSGEKILLHEDFSSNKRGWYEASDTAINWKLQNGKYLRENLKDPTYCSFIPVDVKTNGSYSVTLTTVHLSGINNMGYGISFGAGDIKNLYAFTIASTGHYSLGKWEKGVFSDIIKWTTSNVINKENNVENTLAVKKEDAEWKFYINDQFVAKIASLPLFGYNFGVTNTGKQRITFDNLVVKDITPAVTSTSATSPPATSELILLNEDFSNNNSGWSIFSDENVGRTLSNGKYILERKVGGTVTAYMPVDLNTNNDYSITLAMRQLSGADTMFHGIYFGARDLKNCHLFLIDASGYLFLLGADNDKTKIYSPLAKANELKKGNNAENVLTIKKEGTQWKLFINSQFISSIAAQPFFGSYIGLYVEGKHRVEFDNLVIKEYPGTGSIRPRPDNRRLRN